MNRSMTCTALSLSLSLSLFACVPEIQQDGAYTCADGECPDNTFTCRSDKRCYGPNSKGFPLYTRCATDDECEVGTCNILPDANWGECGVACTTSSACETRTGTKEQAGACLSTLQGGLCVGQCDTDANCDADQECLTIPMAMGVRGCLTGPAAWMDVRTCTSSMGECSVGMTCARDTSFGSVGVCSYPCGNLQDGCPGADGVAGAHECVALGMVSNATPSDYACLRPCMNVGECGGNAAFVCDFIRGTSSKRFCIPTGWK